MKHRSVLAVILLSIFTLGIYTIVWLVKTKREMNSMGAEIPTAWWIIVPIGNIWWTYKYSQGVEKVTKGKVNAIMAFVLFYLLWVIGMAILQSEYNKLVAGKTDKTAEVPAAA
jgi:hypothetical protein